MGLLRRSIAGCIANKQLSDLGICRSAHPSLTLRSHTHWARPPCVPKVREIAFLTPKPTPPVPLTQQEVAEEAGASREALSMVENGCCGVGVNTLDAVLDVLGYEIALLRRTRQGQRMRDCARSRLPPLLAKAAAAGR